MISKVTIFIGVTMYILTLGLGRHSTRWKSHLVVNAVNLISCEFSVLKGHLGIEKGPTYILFSKWTIGFGWYRFVASQQLVSEQ